MALRERLSRTGLIGALLTAAAIAFGPAATPVRADIIPLAEMLRGISMTPEQCAALPNAVWVSTTGREYCVRYYISTAGGQGDRPVVFLQGDKLGVLNLRTGEFRPPSYARDINTVDLLKTAESISKQYRTTGIYLARVGVDGSSGHHNIRGTVLELNATNAALEAIKQRHGFAGFHLIGQSGGASLIGGVLGLRTDIACAVIGAGRLALLRPPRQLEDPVLQFSDPLDGIPAIAANRATRILVVTDPADRRVPERNQTTFVEKLREAGGAVEQFTVEATDQYRHAVVPYARLAAAGCIRGTETGKIADDLRRLVERRVAYAKAANKPSTEAPARTVPDPLVSNTSAPGVRLPAISS